jgi:hypothetical protein
LHEDAVVASATLFLEDIAPLVSTPPDGAMGYETAAGMAIEK